MLPPPAAYKAALPVAKPEASSSLHSSYARWAKGAPLRLCLQRELITLDQVMTLGVKPDFCRSRNA